MAVTYGTAAKSGSTNFGTSLLFSMTWLTTDSRIMIPVGADVVSPASITGVTLNGVNCLSAGAASLDAATQKIVAWYYIDNQVGTTGNVVVTSNTTITGIAASCIPVVGADLTRAPLLGAANSGTSTTPGCNIAVGGGANDLQLGAIFVRSATLTSAGAPQAVVPSTPTIPILAINTADSYSVDSITGAGPFGWTSANGNWAALGITIFAPAVNQICWVHA